MTPGGRKPLPGWIHAMNLIAECRAMPDREAARARLEELFRACGLDDRAAARLARLVLE